MFFLVGSSLVDKSSSTSKWFTNKSCVISLDAFQETPFKNVAALISDELVIPVGIGNDFVYKSLPAVLKGVVRHDVKGLKLLDYGTSINNCFLQPVPIPFKKGEELLYDSVLVSGYGTNVFLAKGSKISYGGMSTGYEYFPHNVTTCLNFVKGGTYVYTWWCEKAYKADSEEALKKGCLRSSSEGWFYTDNTYTQGWFPNTKQILDCFPDVSVGSITVLINTENKTFRVASLNPIRFINSSMYQSIVGIYLHELAPYYLGSGKNISPTSLSELIDKYGIDTEEQNIYTDETPPEEEENSEYF